MLVSEGDHVERGQAITEGQLAPQDITEILGLDAAYDYIIREVQSVYRRQNVDVNDRHIEVIASDDEKGSCRRLRRYRAA